MRHLNFATLALLLTISSPLALGCGGGEASRGEEDLIGGRVAAEGEFASTLLVRGNCTAARIGPRHLLTAAHCVQDYYDPAALRAEYQESGTLELLNAVEIDGAPAVAVTVERTHVHPSWLESCPADEGGCMSALDPPREVPADIAVVVLQEGAEERLSAIPEAAVDLEEVLPGDRVVIMGYGCDDAASGTAYDYERAKLKVAETTALPAGSAVHEGSFLSSESTPEAKRNALTYLYTPGQSLDEAAGSLCPGDSGGPLYRAGSGRGVPRIVGVNANYTFAADDSGVSVTNLHTRLDLGSRHAMGAWLRMLGVRTVGGPSPAPEDRLFEGCETSASTGRAVCGAFLRHASGEGMAEALGAPTTDARLEDSGDGRWLWTQWFEKKKLTLSSKRSDARVVETDPCEDAGVAEGTTCDPAAAEVYTCAGGKLAGRASCEEACEAGEAPAACAPSAP